MDASGDIAIVGLSGLFPKAASAGAFWSNILNKVDAVGDPPDDWLGDEVFLDPEAAPNEARIYTQRGGFLGALSRFDPRPYGTMPVSVMGSEPDQFLALKAATEALADAGYRRGEFDGSRCGIFLGHAIHANRANVNGIQQALVVEQVGRLFKTMYPDLADDRVEQITELLRSKLPKVSVDAMPGLVPNMMTGRIANRLDLMGPNYILDAACASSLVSMELAINELRAGRADLMLAGGINTTTSTMVFMVFCQLEALSRSSRIRPFDKAADGTLLGEGQGIVVLKRLEDALDAGDRIYAVIKGVASSSDGRATGLMAPRLEGEVLAMQRAYRQTGIDPSTIGLVEAHGTGIPLGDRLEIQALRQVMGERERPYPHIALGSVKSMIGHCIPAAGVASVIKMSMALKEKILPPTLLDEVSPDLGLEATPFYLNTETAPWIHPGPAPRRAAINAFGFGGINAHMILEEPPGAGDHVDAGAAFGFRAADAPELLVFTSATRAGLVSDLEALKERLAAEPGTSLPALAADSHRAAEAGDQRLAIVAEGGEDLNKKIDQALKKLSDPEAHRMQTRGGVYFTDQPLTGKLAFVFPGENSQYSGMLKDLAVASPLVRDWFDQLDGLFAGERDVPHRLLIFPPPNNLSKEGRAFLERRLLEVDAGSESVFFADQALFGLLRALGLEPDFMLGHSTGENACLVASGILGFTRQQVGDYIRAMNRIYRRLEDASAIPKGTLLNVGAVKRDEMLAIIEAHEDVHFTMDNCPNQAILFGPDETMEKIAEAMTKAGGICQRLPLAWAYHTPMMAPMAEAFRELFGKVKGGTAIAQLYSGASAGPFPGGKAAGRRLVVDQYVKRVRFTEVVERMYEDGARFFVEVGPSGSLTAFVRDILKGRPHLAVASNSRKRSGLAQFHHLLGQLFIHRVPMNLAALHPAPSEAARAEAERAEKEAKAPYLPNELPYIRLSAEEAAETRAMLEESGGPRAAGTAAAAPPPQATVPPPVQQPRPDEPQAPIEAQGKGREAVLSQHFGLMNAFLRQQEAVTTAMLARLRADSPTTVQDWNGIFSLPFPAEVHLAAWNSRRVGLESSDQDYAAMERLLSPSELAYWEVEIRPRSPRRNREWLLGRLAAKCAVRSWLLRNREMRVALEDIDILYKVNGKPAVTLGGDPERLSSPPDITLSHTGGTAVAAASGHLVGIDIERQDRVRDIEGFARTAFGPEERSLLDQRFQDRAGQGVVALWSIKEAAAKSVGEGLFGRERSFLVTDLAADGQSARVSHDGGGISVQVRRRQDLLCALAYPD